MNNNIFGSLATDLAKTAGGAMNPGAMKVPGAGAANQGNKPGLFGLGGPSAGLFDKFGGMINGMFGGGSSSAPGMPGAGGVPKFTAGGGVGGDNPYSAQVTQIDQQIESIKNAIVASLPKEQWEEAMQNQVFPLMQKRQELATMSQQWDADPNNKPPVQQPGQQQPNVQVNPNTPQGMEAMSKQTEFGPGAEVAKTRKIIIEEKPQ